VVATPAACKGLEVDEGDGVLVASTPDEFVAAVESLHGRPDTRRRQVERGRQILAERHDPSRVADRLDTLYRDTVSRYATLGVRSA